MTEFSSLKLAARRLWAKSGEPRGHGVLAHILDVAAVAETILRREPPSTPRWIARELGLSSEDVVRWIACLVGLHDFGKAIPGFQNKWPDGRQACEAAGLSFARRSLDATDHARASAVLLPGLLSRMLPKQAAWVRDILQAVSAHHGYNFSQRDLIDAKPRFESPEWAEARSAVFEAYWTTLAPQGEPSVESLSLPAVQWLAGLTSVADWIGSNPEWFVPGERHDDLNDHYEGALARAKNALQVIGWRGYRALLVQDGDTDALIGRIAGQLTAMRARPLQQEGDSLLEGAHGPALLLVEAPMGEGKTELAFLAHLRLQAANQHRGLYVALPTQATGNAMFQRALTFLQAFSKDDSIDMQLVHGGAGMNEQVLHLRDIYGVPGENVSSSAWFSQRRRPLLSSYGVGTVDQALFAALNVKHHFVRLWGLSNRVVVLDEVHAYDIYTTGLIIALLRWLKAMGSSVVLMSATLPMSRRHELLKAWGVDASVLPEQPYPRLLLADARGVCSRSCQTRPLPPITLQAIAEDVNSVAACALELLLQGGCGALIVNTVDRAQSLYRILKLALPPDARLVLFHARFPADQRAERENEVLACFGRPSNTVNRPMHALLIATQVAEQSLDIDFDFMLTDLAPVDLILQRAGRLHRHDRQRPAAHAQARLFVAGLNPGGLPDLKTTAWEYVYDAYVLGRTWALLSRESVLNLPQDIDRLVQAVYGDAALPIDIDEKDRERIEVQAYGAYRGKCNTENLLAHHVAIDVDADPQVAYLDKQRGYEAGEEGLGLPNETRLGDETITVIPVYVGADGWRVRMDGPSFDAEQSVSDATAKALYVRQIKVSGALRVKQLAQIVVPRAFADHPLLRHTKPLPLVDRRWREGKAALLLDDELGLIFEKSPPTEL
jgi:CRISPR-associated endonuclease/helicase Cas3